MTSRLSALLLLGLVAVSPAPAFAQARGAAGGGAAQADLNRAADAVLALKSTRFSIKREGAPAYLDEKSGITFTAADCIYQAPDRVSCNVKVALKNGSIVQLTRVWVPEGMFQSNPLTKQWAKLPPDTNFNGSMLFARNGIAGILKTDVAKATVVGKEKVDGRDTVHLKGEVSGAKLNPLIGSTLKADVNYPVDLWMEEASGNAVQLHVAEPDGNGWMIELSGTNEPQTIATPQLPPAAGR
jgi:hypothetical protein